MPNLSKNYQMEQSTKSCISAQVGVPGPTYSRQPLELLHLWHRQSSLVKSGSRVPPRAPAQSLAACRGDRRPFINV
jgi:hypothetical protein